MAGTVACLRVRFDVGLTGGDHLFEFPQRPGPVALQESRERPVREESPAGLAAGAVVRFVTGIDDSLDGSPAHRARLTEAAVDSHAFVKRLVASRR